MSDQNFANELPAPFMSIEETTTTTTTTTTSTTTTTTPRPITAMARRTPTLGEGNKITVVEFQATFLGQNSNAKGGFKSEDTGKILRLQHKYSKSLS